MGCWALYSKLINWPGSGGDRNFQIICNWQPISRSIKIFYTISLFPWDSFLETQFLRNLGNYSTRFFQFLLINLNHQFLRIMRTEIQEENFDRFHCLIRAFYFLLKAWKEYGSTLVRALKRPSSLRLNPLVQLKMGYS